MQTKHYFDTYAVKASMEKDMVIIYNHEHQVVRVDNCYWNTLANEAVIAEGMPLAGMMNQRYTFSEEGINLLVKMFRIQSLVPEGAEVIAVFVNPEKKDCYSMGPLSVGRLQKLLGEVSSYQASLVYLYEFPSNIKQKASRAKQCIM
jgi:hypothetical protein